MAISEPNIDADDYFIDDEVDVEAEHGTTVQAGWDAFDNKPSKKEGKNYPNDFKPSEKAQLVRFLEDTPFGVYEQHWIDRTEGKRSFVCLGADCPLCHVAGDKPRQKVAFNVLNLSEEEPTVQILTAPVTLARQLRTAHEDPRRGPLTKYYWTIARFGTGRETQYTLERVRGSELADEWDLDPDEVSAVANNAVKYTAEAIYVSPHEELLEVARQLVS